MKIAIIHYWLVTMRGGEKVIESLSELYPDADIYTHVLDEDNISPALKKHTIHTSFINRLPRASRWYKNYLPLMPIALEQLDLRDYDLVISSESGPAKGVITRSDALHICYCHTPMRYAWDMYQDYLQQSSFLKRLFIRPFMHYIRLWDYQSAQRVDHFIANSHYIAQRIQKYYRRTSTIIHPPVDIDRFKAVQDKQDYYLFFGQLVGYKKADIAVDAFNQLGKKLVIIGTGEEANSLKQQANSNIEFLGRQDDAAVEQHLQNCKALIFPGVEDFGIVPLEAMACGTPVIAFAKGGATETVIDKKTGVYFHQQTADSLIEAIAEFEQRSDSFDAKELHQHAMTFSKQRFAQQIKQFIDSKLS